MTGTVTVRCPTDGARLALYGNGAIWFREEKNPRTRRGTVSEHRPRDSMRPHHEVTIRLATTEDRDNRIMYDRDGRWTRLTARDLEVLDGAGIFPTCPTCGDAYGLRSVIASAKWALRQGHGTVHAETSARVRSRRDSLSDN